MSNGTDFRYVQFTTLAGMAFACMSIEWEKSDGRINYTTGMSFCSPKDVFDKTRARRVAEFRRIGERQMSKGRSVSNSVPQLDNTKFISNAEFDSILKNIFRDPKADKLIPAWALKSFLRGDYRLGLTQVQKQNVRRGIQQMKIPVMISQGIIRPTIDIS